MQKRSPSKKFSRPAAQRKALFNTMANSFFLKEKIKTTQSKAKELSIKAEKMITKAKKGDLANQRALLCNLSPKVTSKLIKEIAPRYKDRQGGYTRVIKLNPRLSDAAAMAIIELV